VKKYIEQNLDVLREEIKQIEKSKPVRRNG
jgi:hypothetical protein